jgi:hypothetical protein
MSGNPLPKLRRLKDGYVMRNHRIVHEDNLTEDELEQLRVQDISTLAAEEQLNPDQITAELLRIDGKFAELEMEIERRSMLTPEREQIITYTLKVLKERRGLLRSLLNKTIPDRKATDISSSISFGVNNIDELPDEILMAAIAGQLDEKQKAAIMQLLMVDDRVEH